MVFRNEMLFLIMSVTAVLWIQTTSTRLNKKKLSKEDENEQERLFQCFHAINCEIVPEGYEEINNECYSKALPQDVELISKLLTEGGYSCNAGDFEALLTDFFCSKDRNMKKKIFDMASNRLVAHTTKTCTTNKNGEDCKRLETFLKCLGNMIQKYNNAGNCGDN